MSAFDPVTLEVLWNRLISIVDETGATLQRTSFSTIVRESNDFACVILDPLGRSLAQSVWSVPSFTGTLPITLKHMLREFPPETLEPGDSLITNDPWMGTGHLPDLTIVTPIFRDGRLVAFVGSIAHSPDMGGLGLSGECREVYEEGLQIPIVKLCQRGELNSTLARLIRANVRVPDQVLGDIHAQLAANATGGQQLLSLMEERGLDDLIPLAEELHARSEAAMRAAIAEIPDGEYRRLVMTDGFDEPITIQCAVRIQGSDIHVDFAGTSPQIERGINCVMNYTYAYSLFAIKCLTNPLIPNNEGGFRPVRVTAPEGCILNPTYPAAVGSRAQMGHFIPSAIFGALAPVLTERVAADSGSPLWGPVFSGSSRGRKFSDIYFFNGGQGYEVTTPLPPGRMGPDSLATVIAAFEAEYTRLYQRLTPGAKLEALNWRLRARGPKPALPLAAPSAAPAPVGSARKEVRPAYFPEAQGFVECPVYDRYRLAVGERFRGPAIVEERESTAVLGPCAQVEVDRYLNLRVTIE